MKKYVIYSVMSSRKKYSFIFLVVILIFTSVLLGFDKPKEDFSELVKVSLREVGNQLLLTQHDSSSLVLPVVVLKPYKYELSFENELFFLPNDLVSIVKSSFEKAGLPKVYRVEVIQCTDLEVAYSYEMKNDKEKNIIPCAGRLLPMNCYTITVRFTDKETYFDIQLLINILLFIAFLVVVFLFYKKKSTVISKEATLAEQVNSNTYLAIGSFHFYPEQNKLVKATEEISLSRKECELLAIFIANPNQVIKREELTKKVWGDHGVIVGRSLDTYISKLRNILREDSSIKISNVHGVGYKLEILK